MFRQRTRRHPAPMIQTTKGTVAARWSVTNIYQHGIREDMDEGEDVNHNCLDPGGQHGHVDDERALPPTTKDSDSGNDLEKKTVIK